jgi:hypothetical protein
MRRAAAKVSLSRGVAATSATSARLSHVASILPSLSSAAPAVSMSAAAVKPAKRDALKMTDEVSFPKDTFQSPALILSGEVSRPMRVITGGISP